jgi:ribosome biogenesis GTPase
LSDLAALGWTPSRAAELAALGDDALSPARIVVELRGQPQVSTGDEQFAAELAGSLRHRARAGALPAIGDWVALTRGGSSPATIHKVLPRRSQLSRRTARGTQVLAANVDLVVIVMGLDGDFNLRRFDRYLALCRAADVAAHVVLSKADLVSDADARAAAVRARAGDTPVGAHDLRHAATLAELPTVAPATTAILLGSSGAGKSTLTNLWMGGEVQRTGAVRAHDSRGTHTTTHRQLFALPSGGLLIDTPGLRALALDDDQGVERAFTDIEALAEGCQFGDCRHAGEPGCAVTAAIESGALSAERLASYHKLSAERGQPARPLSGRPSRHRRR